MPAHTPRPSMLLRALAMLGLALLLVALPASRAAGAQTPAASPGASPAASPAGTPDASPAALVGDPRLTGIKPGQQAWVAGLIPDRLTTYTIAADLDTEKRTIHGTLSVDYINETGTTLETLPFRLYANGGETDTIMVDDVTVNAEAVKTTLTVDNSVLSVPLATSLAPAASVTVAMAFTVLVPLDSTDQYGMLNIDSATGTWAMAEWYPIVAGWDPANGFELDPPSVNGDPVFSTTSQYHVTVTAPAAWSVVSTGDATTTSITDGDRRTWTIETGPVRDFTMVADADFRSVSQVVDGTTITSWFNAGDDRSGEAALTYTAQAIALFDKLLVPYPYASFDVVPVELYGAAGVEFPQLIYIAQSYYGENQDLSTPNDFDFTIAHEVVHQWFYGMVGNNQSLHAFTDEGITNFLSSRVYFTHEYGEAAGNAMFENAAQDVFVSVAGAGADQIVDTPTDDFDTGYAYAWAAYAKAPVGFNAIYDRIGEDAFLHGLRDYINAFAFHVAQPSDMEAALSRAAGEDLAPLWRHWFNEKHGAEDAAGMAWWPRRSSGAAW
ncbi:MAG: M1 family metallopeptidase [Thermomicrobiales bacterium]